MSNKFTQSVLQRLEQEQKIQQKAKPQTKTVTKKAEENKIKPDVISPEIIEAQKPAVAEPTEADAVYAKPEITAGQAIPDISDYLRLEPARTAKNKTFYLDVEVIEALCAAARRQHVTDSKLCNDILRRVLGVGSAR